jgi:UDP:flavonoid glycosyltransferase YjiC (YdhE family)
MHILFTAMPLPSHLRTFIPLAQALIARGHTVTAAMHPDGHCYLEPFGIEVVGAGIDLDRFMGRPLDSETGVGGRSTGQPPTTAHAFAGPVASVNADEYLRVAEELKPDLVVREDTEFGGYLAAEKLRLPHACLGACGAANTIAPGWLNGQMDQQRARLGLPPDPEGTALYRHRFIDFIPPEFGFAKHFIPNKRAFRLPLPGHRGESAPAWFAGLPADRPIALVSTGTLAQRNAGDLLRRAIEALSGLGWSAVVINGTNAGVAAQDADHVHVVDYVPQPLVLPACDLFLTHGGMNSVREAIQLGIPMVLTPFSADQPHNAQRAAELGLGIALDPATATTAQIRDACHRVLTEPAFAARARTAQRHTLALPDVESAVDDLESLI